MKRKLVFISIFVALGVSGIIFISRSSLKDRVIGFLGSAGSRVDVAEQQDVPPNISPEIRFRHYPTAEEKAARERLHPLASDEKRYEARKQSVSTWEEWLDGTTEIGLGSLVALGKCKTPEEVEALRKKTRAEFVAATAELRVTEPPPKDLQRLPMFHADPDKNINQPKRTRIEPDPYEGPQTPGALIAVLDAKFFERHPEAVTWDAHFPKAEFLQRVLDKGYEVKNGRNYEWALTLRRDLIDLKEKPEVWRSGEHGIPITTSYEEYVDGYIDRKIWQHNISERVSEENPGYASTTVFFPGSHRNKYLPVTGKLTYVRRRPDSSGLVTWGAPLTQEQRNDILYRGKHPEEMEIVYIDNDYNVLSEKPEPYDPIDWNRRHTYDHVPEGLRAYDGTIVAPERYEEIRGEPMSPETLQQYNAYIENAIPTDANEAIRAAARDAMQAEHARFQERLRELERFANMTDAEIEAELEQSFTPQLPELPTAERLEKQLWSEVQSARMTPARFEAALKILEQYGPEEGMQRLTKADPKAAAQVKRLLGQPSATERLPEQQTAPEPQERPVPPELNR